MHNSLKLLITFRKCFHDPVYVKEYAQAFFYQFGKNFEAFECNITRSKPRTIDVDNVYQADLCETELILEYSSAQPCESLFSSIIQEWCKYLDTNKLSSLWLRIAEPSALRNNGKLLHSDVLIKGIAFGTLPDMQHFVQHYHYDSVSDEKEIMSTFLHSQRKLMIFTCFLHSSNCGQPPIHNKIQFSYQSISRVVINYVPNTDFVEIFFHLCYTPLLYVKKTFKSQQTNDEKTCTISFLESDQEYQTQTWERTLDFGCLCRKYLCSMERIGKCPVLKIRVPKKNKAYGIIERLIHRCSSNTLFHFASIKTVSTKYEKMKDFDVFPFNDYVLQKIPETKIVDDIKFKCQYAWEVLNSRSLEVKDQISLKYSYNPNEEYWEHLKKKLRLYFVVRMDPLDLSEFCERIHKITDTLSSALFDISEMINKCLIFTFEDALTKLFDHYQKSKSDDEIPEGMCLVRRIVLTPSKILCLPPTEHFDNRVIRQFGPEYLLRVSIQDDSFQKLTYAVQYNSKKREFLMRVMGRILLEGIYIGPRKYDILASSNSQLREHGLWVYAKDKKGYTSEKIRAWMGDFRHINNVAKYMARMGQCFSTSDESVQIYLKSDEVIKLDDIKKKNRRGREYIFSDGVGMISEDLAREVRKALAQRSNVDNAVDLYDPTAFQIRFKGCKGMLAESRSLNGRKIAIRPSMEKFPCKSSSVLEIVKISAPRAVFLNRPLITILENLGVPPSVFLELQKKMVFDLTDSLIFERKARKMLENSTSLDFPFKKLSKSGVSLTQEPFFRSLLLSVYKSMIANLKRKARIAVSPKYGRNMLGVVDETRTLKYGEIFAQYSEQVGNALSPVKPLIGTVVVTKNPCMHPGDVRKFKAVDVPALHHIKDCIVFPAQGKRPHPDEMAGSDLDGDEYVLLWDKKLEFPNDNINPMDYPPNKEVTLDRPIEVEDMIDFLCDYIQNDNIGIMANAYLAWADQNAAGIFSRVCQSIAHKYPQALDFAKSGTTQCLDSGERPKHYPDFMEKGCQNNSYKSDRTLGMLYRVIRNLEASVSNIKSTVVVVPDQRLKHFGWNMFEDLARQRRDQYSRRVKNILAKYGLRNEAEPLTGFISEVSECYRNKYDSENVALLSKKYLFHTMKMYKMQFLKDCEEESRKHPDIPKTEIKYRMASAWYMMTYQDSEASVLSFPWVVSDTLCELQDQNGSMRQKVNSESMFIGYFDTLLLHKLKMYAANDCACVSLLYHTMLDWVQKSSFILTVSSEDIFCMECFERIVSKFRQSKMICCSYDGDGCTCSLQSCSPMKMILECFKYYASEVIPGIGTCESELRNGSFCEGFRDFNLQSLALKTYAVIAITQSIPYLGIVENNVDDAELDSNEEGDPIRVRVTEEFENILTGNVDNVCKILRELSGVKQVHIDGSSDRNHFYMIIQSIGKAFNRWNLEELIMDSKCPSIIEFRLLNNL